LVVNHFISAEKDGKIILRLIVGRLGGGSWLRSMSSNSLWYWWC